MSMNTRNTEAPPIVLPPPLVSRIYPLDPAVRIAANAERAATLGSTRDVRGRVTCRCCGRPSKGWWRDFRLCRRCGWRWGVVAMTKGGEA